MVIDDEDVDSDSQYEMENEKDLSDSEIESDLEEDIVFVFSIEWGFENNKKQFITRLNFCVLFIYLFIYFLFATHTN